MVKHQGFDNMIYLRGFLNGLVKSTPRVMLIPMVADVELVLENRHVSLVAAIYKLAAGCSSPETNAEWGEKYNECMRVIHDNFGDLSSCSADEIERVTDLIDQMDITSLSDEEILRYENIIVVKTTTRFLMRYRPLHSVQWGQ